jgi:protein-disulfide isomerase
MIKKKHKSQNDGAELRSDSMTTREKSNYAKVNKNVAYVVAVLLLISVFSSGYFVGKGGAGGVINKAADPGQAQPSANQQNAQAPLTADAVKGLFSQEVIKFGKGDKKLLIVEVSDPSCPYCQVAAGANDEIGSQIGPQFTPVSKGGTYVAPVPEIKKLVDAGKADFVWLYMPGHGNGELATKALYYAAEKGKFWEVQDLLMSAKGYDLLNNQVKNDPAKIPQLAEFLKSAVDPGDLKKALESGKYDNRIKEDETKASALGISGTPGFILNTTVFPGAYSWEEMKSVADQAQ